MVMPSHFTSLIQASAMYCGPQSHRRRRPRAISLPKAPKACRTPWLIGSSAPQRPPLLAGWQPTTTSPPGSTAPPDTRRRSSSTDTRAAWPGSPGPSSCAPLPLVREAPFFDEVLGQLQPHHQFADLGAGERQLALLRLTADPQAARALLEER